MFRFQNGREWVSESERRRENFWRRSIIYGYRVFCVFPPLSSAAFEALTCESDFPAPKERHFCALSDPIIRLFPVCSHAERAHRRRRHRATEVHYSVLHINRYTFPPTAAAAFLCCCIYSLQPTDRPTDTTDDEL